MTYKHITFERIFVGYRTKLSQDYKLAVQREERLADAAPDLLAALRQLVKDADDNAESLKVWYADHPHLEAARDAIEKAIGDAA